MIRLLAIGRRHSAELQHAIEAYQKRLKAPYDVEWLLVPHSAHQGHAARDEESGRLVDRLDVHDFVVLLDERGKLFDNAALLGMLRRPLEASQRVVFVIGGAYGVSERLWQRADAVWSLSPLVLPHQLVRLVLIEQIYRSQTLAHNHPYHHT